MSAIRTLKYQKTLFVILLIAGCNLGQQLSAQVPEKFKTDLYRVNYGGCLNKVQMNAKKIGDHLYSDSHGNIFFLTFDMSDETGKNIHPIFIQRFQNDCADYVDVDTNIDFSVYDLKNYIDVATFRLISDGVYKDTFRVYYHNIMADGGSLSIGQASSFMKLDKGFYKGSDNHIYIKTQRLINPPEEFSDSFYKLMPDIDVSSYQGDPVEGYGMDNNHVYYRKNTTDGTDIRLIAEADRNSFEIINPYNLSKDKDHVFYYGHVVVGLDPTLINSRTDFDNYLKQQKETPEKNNLTDESQMVFFPLHFDKNPMPQIIDTLFVMQSGNENFLIWKGDTLLSTWTYSDLPAFISTLEVFGFENSFLIQINASDGCPAEYRLLAFKSSTDYFLSEFFGNCEGISAIKFSTSEIEFQFPGFPEQGREKINYRFNCKNYTLKKD